ncbi:MAG: GGDEF domain-containing protein, partial [Chloroflexi bacterium]|nr:GGDEF domain-containing protein [Chloroflexota bacterium]
MARFPERFPLSTEDVDVHVISYNDLEEDEGHWRHIETAPLTTRENALGVLALGSHRETPCDEDALAILRMLATQGGIALENAFLFARMCELATRDSLTGLYNHSHFFELLEAEISRSERHGYNLAVIVLDMDRESGLKYINDTYGHQVGDAVLREVAKLLTYNVRLADAVARYGGDEFAILAPETGKTEAMVLANRLCRRVSETPIRVMGLEFHVTVSGGVAVFTPKSGLTATTLVDLADQGMYLAKEQGGNRAFMVDWD